jgi:hypothetical protein
MPDATPYRSGLPIDTIPESDKDKNCPTFIERKQKYQSVIGSIGWLPSSTRSDLAVTHSFLSAYNNKPSQSHWNATLYVLHYIHSTINYGISFTSKKSPALHTYMSYPHASDTEAYTDALFPKTDQHHRLTTYSDACWGVATRQRCSGRHSTTSLQVQKYERSHRHALQWSYFMDSRLTR